MKLFSTLSVFFLLNNVVYCQFSIHPDLEYGEFDSNTLDLYLPSSNSFSPPFPTVVYLHGGNWSAGDKSEVTVNNKLNVLTSHGFAVASLNYRLSTEEIWDAQLADYSAALEYLSSEIIVETYGLNIEKFCIWGEDAGGHIGLMGVLSEDGVLNHNASIQIFVSFYSPSDLFHLQTDRDFDGVNGSEVTSEPEENLIGLERTLENKPVFDTASPMKIINESSFGEGFSIPRLFLAHGQNDPIVSPEQSERVFSSRTGRFRTATIKRVEAGHGGEEFDEVVFEAVADIHRAFNLDFPTYELVSDISYDNEDYQLLDLYLANTVPEGLDANPLIVYIHGGDWEYGDKSQVLDYNLVKEATSRGYSVASLDFGNLPEQALQTMLTNIRRALQFLGDKADDYNLDVPKTVLWGQDSGAYLAILLALLVSENDLPPMEITGIVSWGIYADLNNIVQDFEEDLVLQKPPYVEFVPNENPENGSPMEKIVGLSLIPANEERFRFSSPTGIVEFFQDRGPVCDFLLVTGTEDSVVSPLQTLRLFNAFKEFNPEEYVVTRLVEGAAHGGEKFFNETSVSLDFAAQSFGLGSFEHEDNNEDIEEILTVAKQESDVEPGAENPEESEKDEIIVFVLGAAVVLSFFVIIGLVLKIVRSSTSISQNSVNNQVDVKELA
eukprot:snap_masked-scaffold_16-processed-gene-3.27-mRNA-1 protein AED:0.46 eAED:0.46 QI:0/-1/0/1/-1/1/1/0/664